MANKVALIAGSTGISGLDLATLLAQQEGWTVYGLARASLQGAEKPIIMFSPTISSESRVGRFSTNR